MTTRTREEIESYNPHGAVARFLKTEAAERALRSGHTRIADYIVDDGEGRIGLSFRGHYTVAEVRALLGDLEALQTAYDEWKFTTPIAQVEGDTFFEDNAGRIAALAWGVAR